MKKYLFGLFGCLMASLFIVACGDDDDNDNLFLVDGQSSSFTIAADETYASVQFTANFSWNAWVESTTGGSDWISIENSFGSAGRSELELAIDYNDSGAPRKAIIIIECNGEKIKINLTQLAPGEGDDDDDDNVVTPMEIFDLRLMFREFLITDFDGNKYTYGENMNNCVFGVQSISGDLGSCRFTYDGYLVKAESSLGDTWDITRDRYTRFASHIAHYRDNRLVEEYDFTYDGKGRMVKCVKSENGKVEETIELTWDYWENVSEVRKTSGNSVLTLSLTYGNQPNIARMMLYDTQLWLDIEEIEFFYYCGLLGNPTSNMVVASTAVETENGRTYNFSSDYEYTLDNNGCPTKIVMNEMEEGEIRTTTWLDFSWKATE